MLEYQKSETTDTDDGWTLLFHSDLIRKTELGNKIDHYSFFDYATNEALHVSDDEKTAITEIVNKIEKEYNSNIDAHSQTLINSNLELLLNYCTRYYDRQFFLHVPISTKTLFLIVLLFFIPHGFFERWRFIFLAIKSMAQFGLSRYM